jgi:hypothetical protein
MYSAALRSSTLVFCLGVCLAMLVTTATARLGGLSNIGDKCSYKVSCVREADGATNAWENNQVTCAVREENSPDKCGSDEKDRDDFWGYVACPFPCTCCET